MDFYIVIFALTAIASFFELTSIPTHYKKNIFWGMIIIYIVISSLRWNNPDWNVYYLPFIQNNDLEDFLMQELDPGFMTLYWLIKLFTDEFSVVLTILAIVIIGLSANFIQKFSPYPLFSLLFWYGTYIGQIFFNRQSLAIAITLVAFRFIVKSKPIPFILLTILAASMQVSTIGFLLAYPIYHLRINPIYLLFGLLFAAIGGAFIGTSALLTMGSLIQFVGINQERLMTKVALYYSTGASDGDYMIFGYIRRVLFLPIELWALPYFEGKNPIFRGCVNLIFWGYGLYFLLGNMSPTVASRVSSPFYFYEVIVVPMLFMLIKSFYGRLMFFFMLVTYAFIKYIYAINMYKDIYIPYVNILFSGGVN